MKRGGMKRAAATGVCVIVSVLFLYPYAWMISGAFRDTADLLAAPLRLWPAHPSLDGFRAIAAAGGITLLRATLNSLGITIASAVLAVLASVLGAYAVVRRPHAPALRVLRGLFLLAIMYPAMLLVIPVYIVVYKLGLLGGYLGIVLFLALGPVQFFLFEQFFRDMPASVLEAAAIDGANEWQVLFRVVVPIARPVMVTVAIISFLLNWSQWFPVLVISSTPDTYTLPVMLLAQNGELGANFQATMALAVVITVPPALLFLFAQRRVVGGMTEGAVKG